MTKRLYEKVADLIIAGTQPVDICHKLHISRECFRDARFRAALKGLIEYEKQPVGKPPKMRHEVGNMQDYIATSLQDWPEMPINAFQDVRFKVKL